MSKSEREELGLLLLACIVGIIIFAAFYNANKINNAIDECEKSLPRNQHCHLVGVPDEVKP